MNLLVHYSEIALKGKNRPFFERKLLDNLEAALSFAKARAKRLYGRVWIKADDDKAAIANQLKKVPGVKNFSFCQLSPNELNKMKEKILQLSKKKRKRKFKIDARRSTNRFEYSSQQINEKLGAFVKDKTGMKVDLENPEIIFWIEVTEKGTFIYTKKYDGIGGLPVGSAGKVVALISGGIDSPVAALLAMKRGCEVIAVHFYNESIQASQEKIYKLAKVLSQSQPILKFWFVPFGLIQRKIIESVNAKYRYLVYRRFMGRIAEKILKREKAKALVTGDSVGQVASQTLENLHSLDKACSRTVLRPLAGYNKDEIIKLAKKFGTYKISIRPYEDCCTYFIATHPATKASPDKLDKQEDTLEKEKLIKQVISKADVKTFNFIGGKLISKRVGMKADKYL